jgi:ribonuclease VapC
VRPKTEPRYILDASAVLTYLAKEPGYDRVSQALDVRAAISAVNLAEVYSKLVARGIQLEPVASRLAALGLLSEPFGEMDARRVAELYSQTRPIGLSLGDRACLSLALRLNLPALTTDRSWLNLADRSGDIRVIR